MRQRERKYGLNLASVALALAIHGVIAALLFVSFRSTTQAPRAPVAAQVEPVKATMVSEAEIQKKLDDIKAREDAKKEEERKAEQRLEDAKREAEEAERKRQQEQKRIAELEKQRKAEQARLAKLKSEQEEKKKRQAEEAKKKALAEKARKEKLARQKAEAEKKRQAELARKRKLEAERKRKAEAERKLAEERHRREAELRAQLAEEQLERQVNAALGQYIPIIRQKVSRNWNQPPTAQSAGITARLKVRLSASGEVISAQIIKSSGDAVFDRSVENAVYKASPLPIPQERGVNEKFLNLELTFRPEDLIS